MESKKYFAVNEILNKEISQIKNKIMLSMNGICAEKMQNSGFNYGKNFGVSWDRLCEIATLPYDYGILILEKQNLLPPKSALRKCSMKKIFTSGFPELTIRNWRKLHLYYLQKTLHLQKNI